jgi:cytochrome P450
MRTESDNELNLNNLFRPEVLANPYPFYHELRSRDPVHWDRSRNAWVLTRYEDVNLVPSDSRFSSAVLGEDTSWIPKNQRAELGAAFLGMRKDLIFSDPPDHTHLRALFGRLLSGRINEELRQRVEQIAHQLLDGVRAHGGMDVIGDFARELPFLVMAEIMGIPREDLVRLRSWSDAHGQFVTLRWDQFFDAVQAFGQVKEYFRGLAGRRRASPGSDLISALVVTDMGNGAFSSEDVLANCAFVLTAAHLNTTNLIGNGLLALLRHPEQLRLLQEQPALLASAVEEMLRYDSPVQMIKRVTREDVVIGGKQIAKGQAIILVLGAANHDPERFDKPERLNLARQNNRHLAFAPGIHYCLGAALGRLEGQVAIATLFERFPALSLCDTPLDWHRNMVIRGLKALPIVF